jgi:hypothetical protein
LRCCPRRPFRGWSIFHSDIRIARSGELAVTERITLEVDDRPAALGAAGASCAGRRR